MYVGIDVGGTYTDAVVLKDGKLWRKIKMQTSADITSGVLAALDAVLDGAVAGQIKRVVLSTTLVTNLIAQEKLEDAGLLVIPGPGATVDLQAYPDAMALRGAIDFRGRETVPLNGQEVSEALSHLAAEGKRKIAVVGKFANRNNVHETTVLGNALAFYREEEVFLGHRVAGKLNFPRRIATTYLTAVTTDKTAEFIQKISAAFVARGIKAPAYILKADAGTTPLARAAVRPVETVYSGPAASTIGALALLPEGETAVVVDIGGTTTDLALILDGKPLMASKGAVIGKYATHVHALALHSLAVGGDSTVQVKDGAIEILPYRSGPACGLGGLLPTPTDALRVLGLTEHGDLEKARDGMKKIARLLGQEVEETSRRVVAAVEDKIIEGIEEMFKSWEQEPAYRVWEVLRERKARPSIMVGIGGAASALVPGTARRMQCQALIPGHAEVANALGAALAEPTVSVTMFADTSRGSYFVEETGYQGKLAAGVSREDEIIKLAKALLYQQAAAFGLENPVAEVVHSELFNMIRGYSTTGRRFEVTVHTPWTIRPLQEGGKNGH